MFELRGLSRDHLRAELGRSSLGQILSSALVEEDVTVASADSYYIRPAKDPAPAVASHKEFWTGAKRLPALTAPPSQPHVSALLVKKQGDYPAFWRRDGSFIAVMEELYGRVRAKNRQMK